MGQHNFSNNPNAILMNTKSTLKCLSLRTQAGLVGRTSESRNRDPGFASCAGYLVIGSHLTI